MLTTYRILYPLLALIGLYEFATNTIGKSASLGLHLFFIIFTIIFIVHSVFLWRRQPIESIGPAKIVSSTHKLTVALVVIAALLTWLLSV